MEKCGVREYGRQLDRSFLAAGAAVTACSYDCGPLTYAVQKLVAGEIFLVHHEPGLVHPDYFRQFLVQARERQAKIVFCCHFYEPNYMWHYEGLVDRFVIHREYPVTRNTTIIPLGCPLYEATAPKEALRERFGLPLGKTILTTIGFLTPWKAFPTIARAFVEATAGHDNLFVNFHTPWPFDTGGVQAEEDALRAIIDQNPQFKFSKEFLPEEETLALARASDVGFNLHNIHTGSVSAATKQFVSARRPLVITSSNHVSDLKRGVLKVDSFDCGTFARAAVSLAENPQQRQLLEEEMGAEYERINMNAVARKYLALFEALA
jgi:hypothetical protein